MSPSRPTWLYGIQGSEGYSHADLVPAGRHISYVCEHYLTITETWVKVKHVKDAIHLSPQQAEGFSYDDDKTNNIFIGNHSF